MRAGSSTPFLSFTPGMRAKSLLAGYSFSFLGPIFFPNPQGIRGQELFQSRVPAFQLNYCHNACWTSLRSFKLKEVFVSRGLFLEGPGNVPVIRKSLAIYEFFECSTDIPLGLSASKP